MSGSSDVTVFYHGQVNSVPISPRTTFSSLLHRLHLLYKVRPDAASPFHLTTVGGASFDKLGDGSVLTFLKDDRRLIFGPRQPPAKRTLTDLLHCVDETRSGNGNEDRERDEEANEGSEEEETDKENQQHNQQGPSTRSPSSSSSSSPVPLPSSSSPIQSQLWRIFTFYCLQGMKSTTSPASVCPFDSLSSTNWIRLLEDSLVVNQLPFSRQQAELLHLTLSKKLGKFSYEAFVLSLLKAAVTAYRHQLSPSAALSSLLIHQILPYAQRDNPLQHKALLSHPTLTAVIIAFHPFLSAAFTAYSSSSSSSNPDLLPFSSFMQWVTDCKLTKLVPAAETARCFVLSVEEEEEVRPEGGRLRLTRAGFIQCVSRLIVQGLGRKFPLNANTAKAFFSHCHEQLSLQRRLLKAAPADRRALDRMQKSLEAAFQLMTKQGGKRDFLQAAATIQSSLSPPPPLSPFDQQPWQQLMLQDTAFAAVAASLSSQAEADTGRPATATPLSSGTGGKRPGAVKTTLSGSKTNSSGKKAAKARTAVDGTREAPSLFGSPRTPRVVALVPRTPAAKKASDNKRRMEIDSAEDEEDDEDAEREDETTDQLAAEASRTGAAAAKEQREVLRTREEEDRKQQQQEQRGNEPLQRQAKQKTKGEETTKLKQKEEEVERGQQEEATREDRWRREKEAEVAKARDEERLERERKEEQLQREIQRLRQQLASQQRRSDSKPRSSSHIAPAATPSHASHRQEEEEEGEDGEEEEGADENDVTVIGRSRKEEEAAVSSTPLAAFSPPHDSSTPTSAPTGSTAAPPLPQDPARPVPAAALGTTPASEAGATPAHLDRHLPTTVLPAKKPSQRPSIGAQKRLEDGARSDKAEDVGVKAMMAGQVAAEREREVKESKAMDAEEEDEDEDEDGQEEENSDDDAGHGGKDEEDEKDENRRLIFHASVNRGESSEEEDEEDEEEDEGSSARAAAKEQNAEGEEDEGSSEEDADDTLGPFTVAIDCSYSVNRSLNPIRPNDGDDEDARLITAVESSITNATCVIHSNHRPHSQSHTLPSSSPDPPVPPEPPEREEGDDVLEGPAVYPAPFDEALHEERLRLLQAELKERVEARRRLLRRSSYMEEMEDKRLQGELRAKQKALTQLRLLRAKQERERARAEEEQEKRRREQDEAMQRLKAEEEEKQREQTEMDRKAKAEKEERWRQATLEADAARRAQQQRRQDEGQQQAKSASPTPTIPHPSTSPSLLALHSEAQHASLVRAVERGDTFTRYYAGWWQKPKRKFVRVSDQANRIYWGPDIFHLDKWIDLTDLLSVKEASASQAAQLLPVELLSCGLTLDCGQRTIHLLASSHATREVWKRYFESSLKRRHKPDESGNGAKQAPARQSGGSRADRQK